MNSNDRIFESILRAIQKTGDTELAWQFQRELAMSRVVEQEERRQFVKEVADEVLSRITTTVDIHAVLSQIDEVRRAIERLGK